jgi:hypothetical protein
VHDPIASAGSAWSYGGSILTFAFPMILFIGVAVALYVLYTKPEIVPGHRAPSAERPVSYTAIPGTPTAAEVPGNPASAAGDPASAVGNPASAAGDRAANPDTPGSPAADDGAKADEGESAEPEGRA